MYSSHQRLHYLRLCKTPTLTHAHNVPDNNLTVADWLVGVVTVPFFIYYREEIKPGHGFSWRELITINYNIFPLASQANLSLISLERLNATLYPFRHCLTEKWVYFRIIIGNRLVALLLSSGLSFLYLCVPEAIPYAWPSYSFVTPSTHNLIRYYSLQYEK